MHSSYDITVQGLSYINMTDVDTVVVQGVG